MPHWITQCYLPPGRGDIPALTPVLLLYLYCLTCAEQVELVCSGWAWPVPHVVWTRADDSRHAYADSDPGITLSDVVTPYNATLRGAALHIHAAGAAYS